MNSEKWRKILGGGVVLNNACGDKRDISVKTDAVDETQCRRAMTEKCMCLNVHIEETLREVCYTVYTQNDNMALSFDFSSILSFLGLSVREIQEEKHLQILPEGAPFVLDHSCLLKECLEGMYSRSIGSCMVEFPNGIPQFRKYASVQSVEKHHQHHHDRQDSTSSGPDHTHKQVTEGRETGFTHMTSTDPTPDDIIHQKYAFLDMRDVLTLLIERYAEVYGLEGIERQAPDGNSSPRKESHLSVAEFLRSLQFIPVGEVANISGRNQYGYCTDDISLRHLIKKLDTFQRIPIFSSKKKNPESGFPVLLGVFAVTDFLRFLESVTPTTIVSAAGGYLGGDPTTTFARKATLTPLDSWTAGQIKAAVRPTRSRTLDLLHICFEDEYLLDGLKTLHRTGFSALPIVSHANPRQCMGVFSVRDLQPILLRNSELIIGPTGLHLPILDYVSALHQLEALKARYPFIHVRENATIDAVIGKILASNVRRLLLTDDEGLLTGVLSVTDLGRFIAREIGGQKK